MREATAASMLDHLVHIWIVDPETGRRALGVLRDFAELTPEERRRVRALAPDADIVQAERAIGEVWRPTLSAS